MPTRTITYTITFRDFQFLQRYMARRIFAKYRASYALALISVVLCAFFLAMVLVVAANPYSSMAFFAFRVRYPTSFYLLVILCLLGAIASLLPAVRLRMRTLRMHVSNNSPFLGATNLIIEEDGLTVERPMMQAKYLWRAFQGVEIARNAVVLPLDNGIGVIIPATAFASDADRYEFVAAIAKRLEESRAH